MSTEKTREFLLTVENRWNDGLFRLNFNKFVTPNNFEDKEQLHVIEKSAYDAVVKERDELKEKLESNYYYRKALGADSISKENKDIFKLLEAAELNSRKDKEEIRVLREQRNKEINFTESDLNPKIIAEYDEEVAKAREAIT